jgi:hypothetical protein
MSGAKRLLLMTMAILAVVASVERGHGQAPNEQDWEQAVRRQDGV